MEAITTPAVPAATHAMTAAYIRWLAEELRVAQFQFQIDGQFPHQAIPANTGVDCWHYGNMGFCPPGDGVGPEELPAARAERVLAAAGVDLDHLRRASHWRPWSESRT